MISDHVDTEFDMDVHSDEMATRSKELHSILVSLLRNRSLKVLRGVSGRNGYEFTDSFEVVQAQHKA
jgi:hypothetical protein